MSARPRTGMDRSPPETDVLGQLRTAELTVLGALAGASNRTLLVELAESALQAVYKPRRGERPLWDFPTGTLCQREVAAYQVSDFLGWQLVPPTVLREGPYGIGSVQQFVLHDPQDHYFTLVAQRAWRPRLTQLATFDLLINNADRKGGHVLRALERDELVAIDNGLSFHVQPKLRTVIWDLGPVAIPDALRGDLVRLARALEACDPVLHDLRRLLTADELRALCERARRLAAIETLPHPEPDRRPYPWPPL